MHEEQEIADVVVVLADEACDSFDDSVESLKTSGMSVSDIDKDNGVVEGTVKAEKVGDLKRLSIVKYVRQVFDYTADLSPTGDEGDGEDTDDAGR